MAGHLVSCAFAERGPCRLSSICVWLQSTALVGENDEKSLSPFFHANFSFFVSLCTDFVCEAKRVVAARQKDVSIYVHICSGHVFSGAAGESMEIRQNYSPEKRAVGSNSGRNQFTQCHGHEMSSRCRLETLRWMRSTSITRESRG